MNFFSRTLTVVNKMKAHGEMMEQPMVVEKIPRSMYSRFDYVVCSIEQFNNVTIMSIEELKVAS